MGRILEALAGYDYARARSLPGDDRPGEDGEAVLRAAFVAVVRRRFPSSTDLEDLSAMAARVAAAGKSFSIAAEDLEQLAREAVDGTRPTCDLDRDTRLQAEIALLIDIIDQLGLFAAEIATLIRRSERHDRDQT